MSEPCGNDAPCGPICEVLGCAADDPRRVRWTDLFGAAPDFTGGQDVGEFLDESRGEA